MAAIGTFFILERGPTCHNWKKVAIGQAVSIPTEPIDARVNVLSERGHLFSLKMLNMMDMEDNGINERLVEALVCEIALLLGLTALTFQGRAVARLSSLQRSSKRLKAGPMCKLQVLKLPYLSTPNVEDIVEQNAILAVFDSWPLLVSFAWWRHTGGQKTLAFVEKFAAKTIQNSAGRILVDPQKRGIHLLPMSVWPTVLERAHKLWRDHGPSSVFKSGGTAGLFYLLRHGPAVCGRPDVAALSNHGGSIPQAPQSANRESAADDHPVTILGPDARFATIFGPNGSVKLRRHF